MLLTIEQPEDIEFLWQVFEELRDCQNYIRKLPKYCSGWEQRGEVLYRKPQELEGGRLLHVKILFGPYAPKLCIWITKTVTPKLEMVKWMP